MRGGVMENGSEDVAYFVSRHRLVRFSLGHRFPEPSVPGALR